MDAPSAHAQDFALAQRAAEGDARAERQIAQRLMARVRRAADTLLGGALEADDAAQQALIELLRAARAYAGETSIESWADRLLARSLVRFARAVRARQSGPGVAQNAADPLAARTLEEFLRALPSAEREALILREAFRFDLLETARYVRSSPRTLREQLARARRLLYLRTLDERSSSAGPQLEGVERWFALRDREHVVSPRALDPDTGASNDALGPEEQAELRTLETQPGVRRIQKELKGLVQLLEGGRSSKRDKKLMTRALAAVRVSSEYGQSAELEAAVRAQSALGRELSDEPADGSWVRPVSIGLCVLMVVVAFVALAVRPTQLAVHSAPSVARSEARRAPTVQAMSSAQAVARGARLSRDGELLAEGTSLREDDRVTAGNEPGCVGLSPRADVCLAAGSEARIVQLGLPTRRVELMRGRAVVSVERAESAAPFALTAGTLSVEASDAVFGLEQEGEQSVVRVLRGSALITTPTETHALTSAQSAIYRVPSGQLELAPQPVEKARRDWELLAAREIGQAKAARAAAKVSAPAEELPVQPLTARSEPPSVSAPPPAAAEPAAVKAPEPLPSAEESPAASSAEKSLAKAQQRAASGRYADAAALCLTLIRTAPDSASAREALLLRGELLSERLGHARQALEYFERYLRTGGGPDEARARYGRILALRRMGREVEERAATQEFLFSHADAPQAEALKGALSE